MQMAEWFTKFQVSVLAKRKTHLCLPLSVYQKLKVQQKGNFNNV
jgi:hypothetical protein